MNFQRTGTHVAPIRIAVLITCHNRRETTLDCLQRLFSQKGLGSAELKVFLVDDGSEDGTGAAVRRTYPGVTVMDGDGSLFWVGGMRRAFAEAFKTGPQFYLWLNDDTRLFETALCTMLNTHARILNESGRDIIVAGSVCDDKNNRLTYGGSRMGSRWHPTRYEMISPSGVPQPCDLFHGNCVLIPRKIAEATGNMSADYRHGPGDKDYAIRARKAGYRAFICPGFAGTCSRNSMLERWKTDGLSMKERINALNQPVIVARVNDWVVYAKKYHRLLWPYFFVAAFIRLRMPRLYILWKMQGRMERKMG